MFPYSLILFLSSKIYHANVKRSISHLLPRHLSLRRTIIQGGIHLKRCLPGCPPFFNRYLKHKRTTSRSHLFPLLSAPNQFEPYHQPPKHLHHQTLIQKWFQQRHLMIRILPFRQAQLF